MSIASDWISQLSVVQALEPPRYKGQSGSIVAGASVTDTGSMRVRLLLGGQVGSVDFEVLPAEAVAFATWVLETFKDAGGP